MDTPKTLLDAARYFADRNICEEYMKELRWHGGKPICPKCGSADIGEIATRHMLRCRTCRKQFSVREGTLFADSAVPLGKWLCMVWCEVNHPTLPTRQIASALEITLRTAWSMRAIIRSAIAKLPVTGEEWRAAVGYEGLYEVSNLGRVRTLPHTRRSRSGRVAEVRMRLLRPVKLPAPHNHWTITLSRDRHRVSQPLHTMVLVAFAGPSPAGMECRHVDGNPDNNRVDNLQWGTPAENAADRDRHGTTARGERNGCATLTNDQVREIKSRPRGYGTGKRLAAEFGVSESVISDIRTGRQWGHIA